MTNQNFYGIIWVILKIGGIHLSEPNKTDNKLEHGFLQVDNQILDLLLCDTKLNVYGVLILCKVREYQRKKAKCFISNITFAKLFKTSESMIKRQVTELYDLGLIESVVALNDGARGKLRLLKIPRNFNKVLNKILESKEFLGETFKGQNSTLNLNLTLEAMDEDGLFKGQFQGSNFDFEPRTDTTFKGQNQGSNPTTFKGHSDPITIDPSTSLINNKLLEGDNEVLQPSTLAPSLTSSTDDSWNATDFENVSVPDATNSVIQDTQISDTQNGDNDDMEKRRYPNQRMDEMTLWYTTELNPIERYKYEIKYPGSSSIGFAWAERLRKENQKDYYTPEAIVEYFTAENRLDYLKQINWDMLWLCENKL